ncbi:MAG: UDP-N-acetylmuramoyl-L-alanyl-D-glutamate--2,6-diaminopimelate ligase [Patescibacteria group bacterium]
MIERILRTIRFFIPKQLYQFFQPFYHYLLAILGAFFYGFPAQKLFVVGITGTKGKSSTAELISLIFESAGYKTALLSTIHFKIGGKSERNLYKMTMPGRFFVQKFLHKAVKAGCTHAVIEMTSEGSRQHRHRYTEMNALVVTNLTPEHIESHGSFEKYKEAKLSIARELAISSKHPRIIVSNADDEHGRDFMRIEIEKKLSFSRQKTAYSENESGILIHFGNIDLTSPLRGDINVENILAAATLAEAVGISENKIKEGIAMASVIEGRLEKVSLGQPFEVVVDYAHTADSMEKVYKIFEGKRKICIFGATGGGRDKWKRPVMGQIARKYCDEIILTNDDPYDEDPMQIAEEVKSGIKNKKVKIIIDRREAIKEGLSVAGQGDVVLITGKGTDPYIMGANGAKIPWDDRKVVREELQNLLGK